ncbi:hypothetical protein BHE74_00009227 [Ensete ventricosum]|nr:hypothetical protein GW17_00053737 [Ensete ventricosum]RWW82315.1 hypothetical protein BHE74_00009227 [Ensete ventricosum]
MKLVITSLALDCYGKSLTTSLFKLLGCSRRIRISKRVIENGGFHRGALPTAVLEQQRRNAPPHCSIVIGSLDLASSTPTPLSAVDDTLGAHHLRCPQPAPALQSQPLVLLRCPTVVLGRICYPPPSLLCCSPLLSLLSPALASSSSSPTTAILTMLVCYQNCRSIVAVASLLQAKFCHIRFST